MDSFIGQQECNKHLRMILESEHQRYRCILCTSDVFPSLISYSSCCHPWPLVLLDSITYTFAAISVLIPNPEMPLVFQFPSCLLIILLESSSLAGPGLISSILRNIVVDE